MFWLIVDTHYIIVLESVILVLVLVELRHFNTNFLIIIELGDRYLYQNFKKYAIGFGQIKCF